MTAVAADLQLRAGRYEPRSAWFEEIVECGPARIKLSVISADGARPSSKTLAAARRIIAADAPALEATSHNGAGFAILHLGTEGVWLLLHWWTDGGVATRKMWRADVGDGVNFTLFDPLYMACVWELAITDFESRAWMATTMSGNPLSDYLAETLPRGTV
jgi:hypothetical protein